MCILYLLGDFVYNDAKEYNIYLKICANKVTPHKQENENR